VITHIWRLYVTMLRYRVAAMIWMFMLLAAAYHGGLERFDWAYLWATIALASSYVAATSVNDVADREIDAINHKGDRARPLVTGQASEPDLRRLHVLAAAVALSSAAAMGTTAVALIALSLATGQAYSLSPLKLSYRTYLAPLVLAVAYVAIPYALGLAAARASPDRRDLVFASALVALFLARITLKDFRDREGDALYGRPTLLLRFGKTTTCLVSLATLMVGNAILLPALGGPVLLAATVELFVAGIGWMLLRLWRAQEGRPEQVAIGIGARIGNGLLITVLGWLILRGAGATVRDQLLVVGWLSALFAITLWAAVARPDEVVIGYKG
jgi:4-hydroxybenzoate polyprenyltransferase